MIRNGMSIPQNNIPPSHSLPDREKMWREYRRQLLGYIRARVGEEEAEDILQDVLLKAWQGRESLKDATRLAPWLYRITRNAIIDYYRRRTEAEKFSEEAFFPEPEDENRAERELAGCLQPMIEFLPKKYGHALQMAELEGMKQHHIAESEGISLSGAKSRVQRGREMLRGLLEECCRVELDRAGRVADYDPRNDCTTCGEC